MNKEQKNIETCLAENILSEVANVPTDSQFRSLVEESFDPLQRQALRQAGYDGYIKVAGTHQPYTFTSSVRQMKSNLILLLRRLWRYPFGRGTTASAAAGSSASSAAGSSAASDAGSSAASAAAPIRSLADMWQHYITRLKGNPEYGIPSRLDQLTDLPDAPALLADRDMSSGLTLTLEDGTTMPCPDGISLAHLLCGANTVTKIIDDNKGWTMTRDLPWTHLKELVLGCEYVALGLTIIDTQDIEDVVLPYCKGMAERGGTFGSLTLIANSPNVKTIYAPKLQHTGGYQYLHIVSDLQYLEELNLPEYTEFWTSYGYSIAANCPALKKIYMPKYRYNNGYSGLFKDLPALEEADLSSITTLDHNYYGYGLMNNCPELRRVKLGVITAGNLAMFSDDPKLIDIEIEGATGSFNLSGWNPTDKGTTFLQNFREHIAERLTDKGTGLTLTLSQEVRNAIHAAEDEYGIENIIITKKGWTISPAPN